MIDDLIIETLYDRVPSRRINPQNEENPIFVSFKEKKLVTVIVFHYCSFLFYRQKFVFIILYNKLKNKNARHE